MDSKEISLHLKTIIENTKRELVQIWVQCWLFEKEVEKPTNMGKEEAQKNLEIYQKRVKSLEGFISIYNEYAKENGYE